MLICAHRGASDDLPENTIVALAGAVELGCDYLEFDVRATRDQRLVVMHDERLDRTTNGQGRVADRTLHELRPLDAGSWKGEAHAGRKIPTLNEALALIQGTGPFIVDFKEASPELVDELALSLEADAVLDRALVTSPFLVVLREFAKRYGQVRLAPPLALAVQARASGVPLTSHLLLTRAPHADAAAVAAASDLGAKQIATLPRTLDSDGALRAARALEEVGVDGVLTHRPRNFLAPGLPVV